MNQSENTGKHVYRAISEVMGAIALAGIAKDRANKQQGYAFRGIDDVYNALAPILAKHNLCILPSVISRECVERISKGGSTLFFVTLMVRFDLVSAVDGSSHSIVTCGEAMDMADKATNKAMSAAYKYACMEAFCIPTEGDNDADSTTHELAPAYVRPIANTLRDAIVTHDKGAEKPLNKPAQLPSRIRGTVSGMRTSDKASWMQVNHHAIMFVPGFDLDGVQDGVEIEVEAVPAISRDGKKNYMRAVKIISISPADSAKINDDDVPF